MTEQLHLGDNLDFMKTLLDNSIDLIYSDILYGTNRNFGEYKDISSDKKSVEDFYIPRLTEMKRLLKDTGSIYLQMDQHINYLIRQIMNDIFGEDNFKNEIIWTYKSFSMKLKNRIQHSHDTIYFYTKSNINTFNSDKLQKYFDSSKRTKDLIHLAEENGDVLYKNLPASMKKHMFRSTHKKQDNDVIFNINNGLITDWWTDISIVSRGNNPEQKEGKYPTQKPEKLLERIIVTSSNEGDTIADFFCGSGSFLSVGKKLKRNVIGCDINPNAIELTQKKLNNIQDLSMFKF